MLICLLMPMCGLLLPDTKAFYLMGRYQIMLGLVCGVAFIHQLGRHQTNPLFARCYPTLSIMPLDA